MGDTAEKLVSKGNIINFKNNSTTSDNQQDDDSGIEMVIPDWYEELENGGMKFKEGVLARHLTNTEKVFFCGCRFYLYNDGCYNKMSVEEAMKIIKRHCLDEFLKKSHLTNVYEEWKVDVAIKPEELDDKPYILNLKNCLLDLSSMETMKHTEKLKSTMQLNVNYDPSLKIHEAILLNQFLDKCIPDEKTRLLAQEMLGYTFLGISPEKFFILTGETNTGKSTFLDLIEFIIGAANKCNVPLQNLSDKFETVHLFNKLVNICADLPQTALKDVGIIKMLTGGDWIHAQYKGKDGFDYKNKAKLIFSCNQLPPNEAEQTNAFYNRLLILSFPHRIANEDIDIDFKKKLLEEIDYIFLWGLEGLKRLMQNNFQFTESEESIKLKEKYKKDSDPIRLFLEDNCEYKDTCTEGIESKELYKLYASWCKELGYGAKNDSVFGASIINIYGKIKNQKRISGDRANIYTGLKYVSKQKCQ